MQPATQHNCIKLHYHTNYLAYMSFSLKIFPNTHMAGLLPGPLSTR